jgi:hypothetical protein
MSERRPSHRLPIWIALVAVLLAALWPARAMPVDEAYGLLGLDICAARFAGQRDDPAAPAPVHRGGDHCPACWLGHAPALPTSPWLLPPPVALAHAAPVLFFSAPRPLHAWLRARSRAPPATA